MNSDGNDIDFDNNDNVDDTGEVNEDIMILMMITSIATALSLWIVKDNKTLLKRSSLI
jgi:hypothetical protein